MARARVSSWGDRPPRKRAHPEDDIQRTVAQVLDAAGVLWCHVPNGGARGRTEAARMVGLGVKAGVPDVLIFSPPPIYPMLKGAALELKAPGSRISPDQERWSQHLFELGWMTGVVFGVDEAIKMLRLMGYIQ